MNQVIERLNTIEKKELANSLTHGFGFILSIIGAVILLAKAVMMSGSMVVAACSIYCFSLILCFLASTLYHSFQFPPIKRFFRMIDHISIFFLIAGSYTPFLFLYLDRGFGWTIFILVWSLVVIGSVFKIISVNRYKNVSVLAYIFMGWMVVLFGKQLIEVLPTEVFWLLLSGGLFYTVGVIFYLWKKLPYNHAVWHLFVLAGALFHYLAVMYSLS